MEAERTVIACIAPEKIRPKEKRGLKKQLIAALAERGIYEADIIGRPAWLVAAVAAVIPQPHIIDEKPTAIPPSSLIREKPAVLQAPINQEKPPDCDYLVALWDGLQNPDDPVWQRVSDFARAHGSDRLIRITVNSGRKFDDTIKLEATEAGPVEYLHDIFLSACEADVQIARTIFKKLKNTKVPNAVAKKAGKNRIRSVFFSTGDMLTEADEAALRQSGILVLVCSPANEQGGKNRAATEIFSAIRGRRHIHTALVDGEPAAAFPPRLLAAETYPDPCTGEEVQMSSEPLAAAFGPNNKKQYTRETMRLLAPVYGCSFDDLFRRHVRQRRRLIFRVGMAAAVIVAAVTLTIFALSMWEVGTELLMEASARRTEQQKEREEKNMENARQKTQEAETQNAEARYAEAVRLTREAGLLMAEGNLLKALSNLLTATPERGIEREIPEESEPLMREIMGMGQVIPLLRLTDVSNPVVIEDALYCITTNQTLTGNTGDSGSVIAYQLRDNEAPEADRAEQPATGEMPDAAEQPATGEMPDAAEQPDAGEMPDVTEQPDAGDLLGVVEPSDLAAIFGAAELPSSQNDGLTYHYPGGQLVFTQNGTAEIRDLNGTVTDSFVAHDAEPLGAFWAYEGKMLISYTENEVAVWGVLPENSRRVLEAHEGRIRDLDISETLFATAGEDGRAILFDYDGNTALTIEVNYPLSAVEINEEANLAVTCGTGGRVAAWELPTGMLRWETMVGDAGVARISPDGKRVVAGYRSDYVGTTQNEPGSFNSDAALLDSQTGRVIAAFSCSGLPWYGEIFAADRFIIAHTPEQNAGYLHLYDTVTGELMEQVNITNVFSLERAILSPFGAALWAYQAGMTDHQRTAASPLKYTGAKPAFLIPSPVGQEVVLEVMVDYRVAFNFYETDSAVIENYMEDYAYSHLAPVICAAFSPDGTYAVTASRDGTAAVVGEKGLAWLIHDSAPVAESGFSPDSRQIITVNDSGRIQILPMGEFDDMRESIGRLLTP